MKIIIAMKPIDKNFAENAVLHKTAGLNIDVCRIKYTPDNPPIPQLAQGKINVNSKKTMYDGQSLNKSKTEATIGGSLSGRWPSNLILSHMPNCKRKGSLKVKSNAHYISPTKSGLYDLGIKNDNRDEGNKLASDGKETIENWICEINCPINKLDKITGLLKSGDNCKRTKAAKDSYHGGSTGKFAEGSKQVSYGDIGNASRFFKRIT